MKQSIAQLYDRCSQDSLLSLLSVEDQAMGEMMWRDLDDRLRLKVCRQSELTHPGALEGWTTYQWLRQPGRRDALREGEAGKILHLREKSHHPWRVYTSFPQYRRPDLQIKGASKGWSTYQWLRQAGWTLLATDQGQSADILGLTQSPQTIDPTGQPLEPSSLNQ